MSTKRWSGYDDAFGQVLWDCLHGGESTEVIERDDGFIEGRAGRLRGHVYLSDYQQWPVIEKRAIQYARGKVLDVGCGGARHALHCQQNGMDVMGIDNSPLAIRVSRERGLKKARVLPITRVSEFRPQRFDTILMLGHNFGLFGSFRRARWLLRCLHTLTTPTARIIATGLDPHQTKSPVHKAYHRRNLQRGRMAGQLRLRVRYKNLKGPWFDYLFVSKAELGQILQETGWRVARYINEKGGPSYAVILEKV